MPWRGPTHDGEIPSLGWQLIEAWSDLFPSPRDESQPFILTDEQALTVVRWYSIHPLTGQFVYRRGCSRRAKGSGKSPIEAAKCISELALSVRFDGWDARGEPVARPWGTGNDPAPWVQIASLSEDQDENTYTPLYFFLTANDGRLADALGIDAGLTRCFLRDRTDAKIEPVTSRAGSREGQPITYATLDETGLMTKQNGGVKLARTIRRNLTKMSGRAYETTNGFVPGEASVAEGTHKAWERGTEGIFYDAVEAPTRLDGVDVNEAAPDDIVKRALRVAYGDAWWVDLDRVVADMRDPDATWSDGERFFFNWNRSGSSAPVDIRQFEALTAPRTVEPGTEIGLGFDGSISNDTTALYGATRDGYVFALGVWERPENAPESWRIPRQEVHDAVDDAFSTYRVCRMYADPPRWETEIQTWQALYNPDRDDDAIVLALDTYSARRFAPACGRFATLVSEGALSHNGSSGLISALAACAKKPVRLADDPRDGRSRFVIVKADTRKIDEAVAAVLAVEAAMTMPAFVEAGEPFMVVT